METDKAPTEDNSQTNNDDYITLSAALLAPLNAIFEAQVHAARAFLNFILQMGFRHTYTEKEKKDLHDLIEDKNTSKEDREENARILEEIEKRDEAKKRIAELEIKQSSTPLTTEESDELFDLRLSADDLFLKKVDYFDGKGNVSSVVIPNLALLPVKPLAVSNANFKFDINVKSYNEAYDQLGTLGGVSNQCPWFLLKPRRIRGEFSKGAPEEKNIQIEVNVSATEMPYGLDKLLTSLTNNIAVVNKNETSKNV